MSSSLSTSTVSSIETFSITTQQQIRAFWQRSRDSRYNSPSTRLTVFSFCLWQMIGTHARKGAWYGKDYGVGMQLLADELGANPSTVRDHAGRLERAGMIERKRIHGRKAYEWRLTQNSAEMEAAAQFVAIKELAEEQASEAVATAKAVANADYWQDFGQPPSIGAEMHAQPAEDAKPTDGNNAKAEAQEPSSAHTRSDQAAPIREAECARPQYPRTPQRPQYPLPIDIRTENIDIPTTTTTANFDVLTQPAIAQPPVVVVVGSSLNCDKPTAAQPTANSRTAALAMEESRSTLRKAGIVGRTPDELIDPLEADGFDDACTAEAIRRLFAPLSQPTHSNLRDPPDHLRDPRTATEFRKPTEGNNPAALAVSILRPNLEHKAREVMKELAEWVADGSPTAASRDAEQAELAATEAEEQEWYELLNAKDGHEVAEARKEAKAVFHGEFDVFSATPDGMACLEHAAERFIAEQDRIAEAWRAATVAGDMTQAATNAAECAKANAYANLENTPALAKIVKQRKDAAAKRKAVAS